MISSITGSKVLGRCLVFPRRPSRFLASSTGTRNTSSLVGWDLNETTKVGTITLQSPETYNALTVEMGKDFQTIVREVQVELETKDIHAIVIQGQGDAAFSAGGNFPWLKSLRDNAVHKNVDCMLSFYNSFLCVRDLDVPTVAALHGPAMGAGACLALACDMRVATSGPVILGFPFSKLGIHSGMGGSWLLQNSGVSRAMVHEILLTGKSLGGKACLDMGLANRMAMDAKHEAHKLAAEIAKQHPVAVRTMTRTLRLDNGLQECLQREAYAQAVCYNRNDWGQGVDAIAEKRDPIFDGYHQH
jgi:enoyl-CoA hydratase/carnithine racemase